ncbi:MAG TPA: copper chaperone PCu(A)C [Pseudonocardiaceae bacterium]|nr:copper chaperone PCu(A)C [Pseudonocardiaceae bacterium]
MSETPENESATEEQPEPRRSGLFTQQGPDGPRWRRPVLFTVGAVVIVAAAAITWVTTSPDLPPAALTVTKAYVPPTSSSTADVYFTLANTGAGPDTLESVGAEYQTGSAAKSLTLCADDPCGGASTVDISATSTTLFAPGGPHIEVTGLGPLRKGHQPLQLTLTFERSGTLHILAPVGTAADLSQADVMTYGYMGNSTPGDGMDMSSGSTSTRSTGTPSTGTPSTGMGDMPGMSGMPGMTMPTGS